jgi:hypothetical protein
MSPDELSSFLRELASTLLAGAAAGKAFELAICLRVVDIHITVERTKPQKEQSSYTYEENGHNDHPFTPPRHSWSLSDWHSRSSWDCGKDVLRLLLKTGHRLTAAQIQQHLDQENCTHGRTELRHACRLREIRLARQHPQHRLQPHRCGKEAAGGSR